MVTVPHMRDPDDNQDKQALLQDHKTTNDSDDNRSTDDYNTERNTRSSATNTSNRNEEHDHDGATATTEYYDSFDVDDSETALLHGNRPRDLNEAENAETTYRLPSEGGSVFASFVRIG